MNTKRSTFNRRKGINFRPPLTLSTLTLFGLFVSAIGARYARGCNEMSADRTPGYWTPIF